MERPEVTIVGGGPAGLTAAIDLSRKGFPVRVLEKDELPRHKVCGEYLSREVLPYLQTLGVDLQDLRPPKIDRLFYSLHSGHGMEIRLPLGGLGISRFALDHFLAEKAIALGVNIEKIKVVDLKYCVNGFKIRTEDGKMFHSSVVLGAFGKRSGLDKRLGRDFFTRPSSWLALKSHFRHPDFSEHTVALHNFRGGYCGLSRTESGLVNACYLVTYRSFREHKNPDLFRERVMQENPHLRHFFAQAEPVGQKELSIAQIAFAPKKAVHQHILMLGDAAGLIHPLCGNGMAMAIHSGMLAASVLEQYCSRGDLDRRSMERDYGNRWNQLFSGRMRMGRVLQYILLQPRLARISQGLIRGMPSLLPELISRTHGKPIAL